MTRKPLLRRAVQKTLAGLSCALVAAISSPGAVRNASADTWRPPPGTSWQWQLQETVDLSVDADVFDIDMDQDASVVAALHAQGRKAICYVNVGAWENWRADAGGFPAEVLGNVYDGFPNERWLDIRQIVVLAPLMGARFDQCLQKGFDAVEPDNMDGYVQDSGFPLSYQDQITYNRWVATEVHARGIAVGLKNDIDQASELQPSFDFAVSEQCFQYAECGGWLPFLYVGKAIFEAEYALDPTQFCPLALDMGISAMQKHTSLDSWRVACVSLVPRMPIAQSALEPNRPPNSGTVHGSPGTDATLERPPEFIARDC